MEPINIEQEAHKHFQNTKLPFEAIVKDGTVSLRFTLGNSQTYGDSRKFPEGISIEKIELEAWKIYATILRECTENMIRWYKTK